MSNDLLIKINADAANATKAFDDIKEKTEDLESTLNKVALISGAAFAAFTSEIYFSVKAFEEAQQSAVQLTTALQNQGIYTEQLKNQYVEFAEKVQAKTGIDDDAIVKAQAVAQTFLGQNKITEELTFAIADLGATMGGDLNSAAEKIARTIGTGTNAFARQGLVIDAASTEAERYAKVLQFVQLKAGGMAEEFNKADGYAKALGTAFGNLQESIGSKFAPLVSAARESLATFFQYLADSPVLTDLIAAFVVAGAAVSGLILFASVAVPAFLALSAAVTAVGLSLSVAFVGIPLIIGAVIGAITLLALNWDKVMAGLKAAAVGAITLISELFSGLKAVMQGALDLDTSKIQAGLTQLKEAFGKAKNDAVETYKEITASQASEGEKQNAKKKELADKEAAHQRQHQANLRAIREAELELIRLQNENASAATIDLKTKEIEILKALDQDKSKAEIALLREKQTILTQQQDEQNQQDIDRASEFEILKAETILKLQQQGIDAESELARAKIAELRANVQTELDIERKLQEDLLTKRTAARNQELLEKKKFGVAYAVINKFIQSDEVQGAKQASDDLVELSQSKNDTLKAIGKAASIAQITIKTAEAAMNIYNGYSIIPIVGPALGIAGAAAAVAFGAERIGAVTAAADGGLMTGGIAGRDSIPTLTMPGELVVPTRNFDEVVGAVANERSGNSGSPEMLEVLKSIDQKFTNPQQNIIQGDVHADDSYIDALVRRISDAVQYRNAQIYGVT